MVFIRALILEYVGSIHPRIVLLLSIAMAIVIVPHHPPVWIYPTILFVPSLVYFILTMVVSTIMFFIIRPDKE